VTSWRRIGSRRLQGCSIFNLDRVRFEPPDGRRARDFYVLEAPDWINVVPLTDDRRVVLVRQYRFGIEGFTLEVPGGMCDEGESPAEAALRELREETGYDARELIALGWVHPNPALQTNRCHSFLAAGAHPAGTPTPDPDEAIEVSTAPLDEIPRLIREGMITHSLVIAAFHLLGIRRAAGSSPDG
jgi:8-oxo-dGTP pyrophosphatase MutT (NUDIX family)